MSELLFVTVAGRKAAHYRHVARAALARSFDCELCYFRQPKIRGTEPPRADACFVSTLGAAGEQRWQLTFVQSPEQMNLRWSLASTAPSHRTSTAHVAASD